MRKRLQQCFERGQELAKRETADHDYAHTMFAECVLNDPSNLEYVEAMFENLQRKYKNNKKGARIKGFGGRGSFKKAVAAEDWDDVFRLGMDLIKVNPWDVATLRGLANACKANHFNEVELRYLKNALDFNAKDIDVNKHCAESLARMGQFDQAIACWHRIEELEKGNSEAKKKISELTLAKTMGVPGTESQDASRSGATRPNASDAESKSSPDQETDSKSPPAPSEATQSAPRSIQQLERAIQDDVNDLDSYIELSERYTEEHRYRDALPNSEESSGCRRSKSKSHGAHGGGPNSHDPVAGRNRGEARIG